MENLSSYIYIYNYRLVQFDLYYIWFLEKLRENVINRYREKKKKKEIES